MKRNHHMAIDYSSTSCVDAFKLIRQVKKHEVLYNREMHGYSDLNGKEMVWEDIHRSLFNGYDDFDDESKTLIRKTVRKRWKSLRDCVVKDLKMRTDNPAYVRRKPNPLVDELQFILPYVKKHGRSSHNQINDQQIDLTSDDNDGQSNSMYYPYIKLHTTDDYSESTMVPYPIRDASDNGSQGRSQREEESNDFLVQENDFDSNEPQEKRRFISDDSFKSQIMECISLIQRRDEDDHDEDRMFLLSLLSDFKQIVPERKLKVKSEIISAICNGLEY